MLDLAASEKDVHADFFNGMLTFIARAISTVALELKNVFACLFQISMIFSMRTIFELLMSNCLNDIFPSILPTSRNAD